MKMEEDTDGPYFLQNSDRTRYPPIPPENAWNFAMGTHIIDRSTDDYHAAMAQHTYRSSVACSDNQLYQDISVSAPVSQAVNQFEEQRSATGHSLRLRHHLPAAPGKVDEVQIKQEVVEDEPIRFAPMAEDDSDVDADGEFEDESAEPEPAPIEFPENVKPEELRYSTKELRDKNMSIFHRKEFAYCEVAMTVEEHFQIKGLNHVTPQTFSMPDKNGKYQKRKRIRISWAERDKLNAWRVENGIKPHELRLNAKYAAAREYWRLHAPHEVKPRKTIEWSQSRGPVPAP